MNTQLFIHLGTLDCESRELERALSPPESILPESCIGDNGALQIQVDYFHKMIKKTEEQERIFGLERCKEWATEIRVFIPAVAISVARLITIVIGSQAIGKFAKAVYNLGKKLRGSIAPLLSVISKYYIFWC